jgi:osmotically-inducible protein OsmY
MTRDTLLVALAVVIATASAAACRDDKKTSETQTTGASFQNEPVATDQSNTAEDLAIAGEVRRRIVLESSLSPIAKNVVIVARDGVVTLRGDVSSEDERAHLRALAMEVHGVGRVDDAMTTKRAE